MAGYLGIITDEDMAASAAGEVDVFDQDNYGGTLSSTSTVGPLNFTFTPSDGRFTSSVTGVFRVDASLRVVRENTTGNVEVKIKKNGVAIFDKYFPCVAGTETVVDVSILMSISASDYVNVTIDSDGAETAKAKSGCVLSMHQL